jgi:hypothetical protein
MGPGVRRDDKRLKSASIRKMFLICSMQREEHEFTSTSQHQSAGAIP